MVSFGTLVKHVHKLELVPCSTVGPTEVKILTFLNLFLGFHIFLAAEGAALEGTIWVSGSKEISVLVMHF